MLSHPPNGRWTMRITIALVSVVSALACSAPNDESRDVGNSINDLSNSEHCDSIPADAFIGDTGSVLGPAGYYHSQCINGFLVDVTVSGSSRSGQVTWVDP